MKDTGKSSFLRVSLSGEELALSLVAINRPDLGHSLMASWLPEFAEEVYSAALAAAEHSLVARGLADYTEKETLRISPELEKMIFPLARFDYLVEIHIVQDERQDSTAIHVQDKGLFTSHFIRKQVVHVLEQGDTSTLSAYLATIFNEPEQSASLEQHPQPIRLSTISEMQKHAKDISWIVETLQKDNWPASTAVHLAEDFARQTYRGYLMRLNAGSADMVETIERFPKKIAFFMSAEQHQWLFEFPSLDEQAVGKACLLNAGSFRNFLAAFTSPATSLAA